MLNDSALNGARGEFVVDLVGDEASVVIAVIVVIVVDAI